MEGGGRGRGHGKEKRENKYTLVCAISDGWFAPSEMTSHSGRRREAHV